MYTGVCIHELLIAVGVRVAKEHQAALVRVDRVPLQLVPGGGPAPACRTRVSSLGGSSRDHREVKVICIKDSFQ
jgi:hypothetical protein